MAQEVAQLEDVPEDELVLMQYDPPLSVPVQDLLPPSVQ